MLSPTENLTKFVYGHTTEIFNASLALFQLKAKTDLAIKEQHRPEMTSLFDTMTMGVIVSNVNVLRSMSVLKTQTYRLSYTMGLEVIKEFSLTCSDGKVWPLGGDVGR
jgi:hypothetical protein